MTERSSNELELIRRDPELFHVAEAGAWPAISRLGLLSTAALLDRFGLTGRRRHELEAAPRPHPVRLHDPLLGEAWIRDNRPLRLEILAPRLEGISAAEWIRLLSARVFFWLGQDRASRLVHARAHRNRAHDVLVLDTSRQRRSADAPRSGRSTSTRRGSGS